MAAEAATTTEVSSAASPVSAQVVGNAFVQQYYQILHHSPALAHRFYHDSSKLGRPEADGSMSITTTMQAINEKILSLNYGEFKAEISSVDAQESLKSGVHVLVTGYFTGKDNMMRNFAQSFFLAPQDKGYFVLNDTFRYVEKVDHSDTHQEVADDVEIDITPEQETAPVLEDHISEQNNVLADEANGEEVYNPSKNGEAVAFEEELPVAEVVDEVPDDSQRVVETNIKIEEVPKKSYASIVMDLKANALPFSSPAPVFRKTPPKSQEQQVNSALPSSSVAEVSISSIDAAENGNNQEEADSYSIYIKGLPYNATPGLLEEEFKRFGPIKDGGIQVRSKQGFCFGFVEFEVASAVEKAIEASPITIGGRQAVVEEKKSNSRVNNRGRFSAGRGFGFRNEGIRGRGNFVGGRGYNRGDFTGRTEFGNRGNNRGGSSNRGGDGYQRPENAGSNAGRANRGSGMASGGNARNMAPRVPATA